ncbi:hypothetical protein CE91St62_07940 [Lachnospiraceae bacterium]|nr:hypothetical protein CE91St61_08030 [Lachnospiraceae bacterium]BDF36733.1 hypothetical protein CE91St62_07940 [Lachnospiraceae bacterium]
MYGDNDDTVNRGREDSKEGYECTVTVHDGLTWHDVSAIIIKDCDRWEMKGCIQLTANDVFA